MKTQVVPTLKKANKAKLFEEVKIKMNKEKAERDAKIVKEKTKQKTLDEFNKN